MEFRLEEAVAILSRTPATLQHLLEHLPRRWTRADEGAETWSPFDVVGHLIHSDRTNWMVRARAILEAGETRPFPPFDRVGMLEENRGKTLAELLAVFEEVRAEALRQLAGLGLADEHLDRTGRHPDLGAVSLRQPLATWVAHDLGHIAQIARTMAGQYRSEVGPWRAYLPVLGVREGGG